MVERTCDPNCDNYKKYGSRGIGVCERWKTFEHFLEDMGERPEGMTIDRIDSRGDYCKENCRWATQKEQQRNKCNNRMITFRGETRCLAEWAELLGIKYNTAHNRFRRGCCVEEILAPVKKRGE